MAVDEAAPQTAETVPPDPEALIESMRALGYSLPAAVADLIDNSISAGASEVDVQCQWDGEASWVAVIDDGSGMDQSGLVQAMKLGSRSAAEERAAGDLGRFGLGLKTAGFSQGRSLTVRSKSSGAEAVQRRWDLDHVRASKTWSLLLDGTGHGMEVLDRLDEMSSGTVVLLEDLDRLSGDSDVEVASDRDFFLAQVRAVEEHLRMVFHRFMEGPGAIAFRVNGNVLVPWNPFTAGDVFVDSLPEETYDEGRVRVKPFVMPHFSRLAAATHQAAAGPAGWNHQQGFYVYRERRLLVAGSWLDLPRMTQEEHYKLARIRVDLDNSLDHAWDIDVRKAVARIPRDLVKRFEKIARATRKKAAEAYRYRGRRLTSTRAADQAAIWEVSKKGGEYSYRLDRSHPAIEAARPSDRTQARLFDNALRVIEEMVPVEAIVMDAREHPDAVRQPFAGRDSEVSKMLADCFATLVGGGAAPEAAVELLAVREPFDRFPEVVAAFREAQGIRG
jgi:hypothetical protein